MRKRGLAVISIVFIANLVIWALAIVLIEPYWPIFLSQCVVAYTFGLRHAIDADHIAAIDNVTRRLVEDWKVSKLSSFALEESVESPPLLVGFFFSLGHSSVVLIAVVVILLITASLAQSGIDTFGSVAGIVGTSISIVVLFALALINGVSFVSLVRLLRSTSTESVDMIPQEKDEVDTSSNEDMLEKYLNNPKGCLGRVLAPIVKTVNAPWKMFPIGFMFGIGFDTSTEIGLLALSASQVNRPSPENTDSMTIPTLYIMFLPVLFTAGMCLIDTCDGVLMSHLYSWAYMNNPFRRIMFNLVITLTSVLFGLFVGVIQLMSLLAEQLQFNGSFWQFWITVSESSEIIGGSMIALFFVAWAISFIIYRYSQK